jgi:hypothetical protein
MTPEQGKRRDALLARSDKALERWPQRVEHEFVREMTAVAEGLEALAREADAAPGDRLERGRNWRFVGLAYFDLANAKDLALLKRAADAYRKAEALLAETGNVIEKMKLDYSFGHTLFHLSDAKDIALLQEARRRYASALEIARAEMPAGVEPAKTALANADGVLALLGQAEGLSQWIDVLKKEIEAGPEAAAAAPASAPPEMEWLPRVQSIFRHLGDVALRVQSRAPVPPNELKTVEMELGELQTIAQHMGPRSSAGKLLQVRTQQYIEQLRPYLATANPPQHTPPAAGTKRETP